MSRVSLTVEDCLDLLDSYDGGAGGIFNDLTDEELAEAYEQYVARFAKLRARCERLQRKAGIDPDND